VTQRLIPVTVVTMFIVGVHSRSSRTGASPASCSCSCGFALRPGPRGLHDALDLGGGRGGVFFARRPRPPFGLTAMGASCSPSARRDFARGRRDLDSAAWWVTADLAAGAGFAAR